MANDFRLENRKNLHEITMIKWYSLIDGKGKTKLSIALITWFMYISKLLVGVESFKIIEELFSHTWTSVRSNLGIIWRIESGWICFICWFSFSSSSFYWVEMSRTCTQNLNIIWIKVTLLIYIKYMNFEF